MVTLRAEASEARQRGEASSASMHASVAAAEKRSAEAERRGDEAEQRARTAKEEAHALTSQVEAFEAAVARAESVQKQEALAHEHQLAQLSKQRADLTMDVAAVRCPTNPLSLPTPLSPTQTQSLYAQPAPHPPTNRPWAPTAAGSSHAGRG